jgi:CysZ protein
MKDFLAGITSYAAALRHVSTHGLWLWVLLPGLFCLFIGIGILGLAYGLSGEVGDWLDNLWKWEWGSNTVAKIARVFGGLLVLLAGLIIFRQIVMVLTGPFMSLLSEKVEHQLRGKKDDTSLSFGKIVADIVRGLRIALRNLFREIMLTVVLLLLGLIPIFTPFTTALVFVIQAYYAGFGNMDFALERHFGYRESVGFVRRHRSLTIGNGFVFVMLLFTFIGFIFALPLGTVAATIETVKRVQKS